MAGYFYILRLGSGDWYYGSTRDLKRRVREHLSGKTTINHMRPEKLIYFECYEVYSFARKREISVKKNAAIRSELKARMSP